MLSKTYKTIIKDEKNHRWTLWSKVTFRVPPRIMPISKNIGFNNLLEKVIFNLVNAIIRLANNEPNNQGRGKWISVPIYPPIKPIKIAR